MRGTKATSATRKMLLDRKHRLESLVTALANGEPEQAPLQDLRAAEIRELSEVDAALHRLDLGTYGRCERCGAAIGALRLHAMPAARLCVRCINEQAA